MVLREHLSICEFLGPRSDVHEDSCPLGHDAVPIGRIVFKISMDCKYLHPQVNVNQSHRFSGG
jgi:hypothetical protein